MNEPVFLALEDVLAIHAEQLARHGGQAGIRDAGLLESAVAMPQASFDGDFLHEDLFAMAAAYAFHIAENQPFFDGNKRAALGAALVFLHVNGVDLQRASHAFHEAMIALSDSCAKSPRRMTKDGLAALFRRLVEPP